MESTTERGTATRGPKEGSGARGVDEAPENRPGVPMETEPSPDEGAHWQTPLSQESEATHFHRKGIDELTPVYGTAQPPRGLSGMMRRAAYRTPEHQIRHWAMLLAADRVDILEHRLGETLGRPLEQRGMHTAARTVEQNALGVLLGVVAAGYLLQRVIR